MRRRAYLVQWRQVLYCRIGPFRSRRPQSPPHIAAWSDHLLIAVRDHPKPGPTRQSDNGANWNAVERDPPHCIFNAGRPTRCSRFFERSPSDKKSADR
jgi:hypothetical protein